RDTAPTGRAAASTLGTMRFRSRRHGDSARSNRSPRPGSRLRTARRAAAGVAAITAVAALSGCTDVLVVDPAENAADPDCALPILLMPDEIGDLPQRTTSSQGTTGWGEPASVIVRCG